MISSLKVLRTCTIFLTLLLLSGVAQAQLSRAHAVRLLTLLGDRDVVVAGVVNGMGRDPATGTIYAANNVAMVIAYTERNGRAMERHVTFFFDQDLGWFYSEVDTVNRVVRLWTTSGYRELRPSSPSGG